MGEPFKISAWYIRDFKTIEVREVLPNGNHVVISGPNASGKTSHLDSILFALQGLRKGDPVPVRHGTDEAEVILELSNGDTGDDLTIRRTVDKDGKVKLHVARDGRKVENKQQGVIDTLLSKYMLNPIDFLKLRPQDQLDTLLALGSAPAPVAEVKEITGANHPPEDGETAFKYLDRLSGDKDGHYYELRRSAKYEADTAAKALDEARETRRNTPEVKLSGDANEQGDSIAVMERQQEEYNEAHGALTMAMTDKRAKVELANAMHARGLEAKGRVEQAKALLAKAEEELEDVRKRYATVSASVNVAEGIVEAADRRLQQCPDIRPAIQQAKAKQSEIIRNQKAATEWQAACDRVTQLTAKKKEADLKHEKYDTILEKLRDLRKKSVSDIDIGVQGLECGDGLLTVEGVPLPAASAAQQFKVACGIAIKQNPRLRLLRIDEGERLDHRSRMQLYDIADKNNCQVILTAVTDQPDLTVTITE